MSGQFKDTGQTVKDMRNGFAASAPVAAMGAMFFITIGVTLVRAAFTKWQSALFWKTVLSIALVFLPFHVGFLYAYPLNDWKMQISGWHYILGFIWSYAYLVVSWSFYARRYSTIQKMLNVEPDYIHRTLCYEAVLKGVAVTLFLTFAFVVIAFFISLVTGSREIKPETDPWYVFCSLSYVRVVYYIIVLGAFTMFLTGLVNFEPVAIDFIERVKTELIKPGANKEEIERIRLACMAKIVFGMHEFKQLMRTQFAIFMLALVLFVIALIVAKLR